MKCKNCYHYIDGINCNEQGCRCVCHTNSIILTGKDVEEFVKQEPLTKKEKESFDDALEYYYNRADQQDAEGDE